MKIWVSPYQLRPRRVGARARLGALVKVEWAMHQIGYSDLHPWPEFGEPELADHIESLAKIEFTKLAEMSLEYNYIDREYRLGKRNAFLGLILPRSHLLVTDLANLEARQLGEWQAAGFTHIKVKLGQDLARETEQLTQLACATTLAWRLDFNGRLSERDFTSWWTGLDEAVRKRIDFVEDPIAEGQLKLQGPWANDWYKQKLARVKVVKPAREIAEELVSFDRVVFTHGLDHPLGQACAAWSAARYYAQHPKQMDVCGLAASDQYEPITYEAAWRCEGPRMKPTTGYGFGFDDLLAAEPWERLV